MLNALLEKNEIKWNKSYFTVLPNLIVDTNLNMLSLLFRSANDIKQPNISKQSIKKLQSPFFIDSSRFL